MGTLSVVTCGRNLPYRVVVDFVYSMYKQTVLCPVIIVDYGSDPRMAMPRMDWLCDQTEIIYAPAPYFKQGHALNIGIRRVITDYLVTVDMDHTFASNFVSVLIETLDAIPNALVNLRRTEADENGNVIGPGPDCALGTCIAARTDWFHRVRGYDELYSYHGSVDLDLVERAGADGLQRVWVSDKTFAIHKRHPAAPNPTEDQNQSYRYQMHGKIVRNDENWGLF